MSEPTIIGLTGYARSGKDTVGRILIDHHGFRRVAFGDLLKEIAEDVDALIEVCSDDEDVTPYRARVSYLHEVYGGWEEIKDEVPEARQFLVDLGNSLRKRIPDIETHAWHSTVKPGDLVVNTNVYHPEEIRRIQELGGVVIRVQRPGIGPANTDEANTARCPVDATVMNDGSIDKLAVNVAQALAYLNVPSRRTA